MNWIKSHKKKIAGLMGLVVALAGIALGVVWEKKHRIEQSKSIREKLEMFLPEDAKGKVYVNHTLKSTKLPLISTVFTISQDKEEKIKEIITNFLVNSKHFLEENKAEYSALTITILTIKDYTQYRVVVGSETWAFLDEKNLLSSLNSYCSKTNPENISSYCNLTPNLRESP